jgi:hypothetical protein
MSTNGKLTLLRKAFTQWSIRGLLVLITCAAIFFAWLRVEMAKEARRREWTTYTPGRPIHVSTNSAPGGTSTASWQRRVAAWATRQAPVAPANAISLGDGHVTADAVEVLRLFPEATGISVRCRTQLDPMLARELRGRFNGDATFSIYLWSGDINTLAQTCAEHDLAVKDLTGSEENWTYAGYKAAAKLRKLDQIRFTNVDDATVALFRDHPRLRLVSIQRSPDVGDESGQTLASCTGLAEISLDGVALGREGLEALGRWQGIDFAWKNSPLSDIGFRKFLEGAGSNLYAVELENAQVEDTHLKDLLRCTKLLNVQISGATFDQERMVELARLPLRGLTLRDCIVDGSPLSDATLAPLAKLAAPLRSIDVDGSDVTDAGVAAIATSPQLFELSLRRTKITSKTLDSLAAPGSLGVLRLGGDTFDASWMPSLAKLTALSHLTLSGPQVDDAVFKTMHLNGRISLILDRTNVTKECLHDLVKWPQLRSVTLAYDVGAQPAFTLDEVRAFRDETGVKIYAGWEEVMEDPTPDSKRLRISISPPGYRP